MNRPDIVRVWGTADSFDIEFKHGQGNEWNCSIPPDTVDGVYAVELYALNSLGKMAHWVGELFMCNGICHFEITQKPYTFWFDVSKTVKEIKFIPTTKLLISKGCKHYD